jgi:UDPglucose 6-dehydrogenase
MEVAKKALKNVEYAANPYEAVENVDAIILATEWNEFKKLDLTKIRRLVKGNIFVDGRNVFDYKSMTKFGFKYYCIGKKDAGFIENQATEEVAATKNEISVAVYKSYNNDDACTVQMQ